MLIRYLSSTLKDQNIDQNYFYIFFLREVFFFNLKKYKIWDTNRTHVLNLKKMEKKNSNKKSWFFLYEKVLKAGSGSGIQFRCKIVWIKSGRNGFYYTFRGIQYNTGSFSIFQLQCAPHFVPISNVFIDWRFSCHVRKTLTTCLLVRNFSWRTRYVTIFIDWKSDLFTYYDWSMNEKNVFHNE